MKEAERVLVPERECRCGGIFMVLQMKGEPGPRAFHKNPPCPQFQRLRGSAFYHWVLTGNEDPASQSETQLAKAYEEICGEEPPEPPKPNRQQRRAARARERGELPRPRVRRFRRSRR